MTKWTIHKHTKLTETSR